MTNVKVKLNVKLQAYTKGIIPDVSKFIEDAPIDNMVYGRLNGEWVELSDLDNILNEWVGSEDELPDDLVDGDKFNIIENTPDMIIIGGTAYSTENEEFDYSIITGNASSEFDIEGIPMNAKGEFNGTKIN